MSTTEVGECVQGRVVRRPWVRERYALVMPSESLVEQSHRQSVDINEIVKRFHRTGQLPPVQHAPQYADVTGLQRDLRERIEFASGVLSDLDTFLASQAAQPVVSEPPAPVPSDSVSGASGTT